MYDLAAVYHLAGYDATIKATAAAAAQAQFQRNCVLATIDRLRIPVGMLHHQYHDFVFVKQQRQAGKARAKNGKHKQNQDEIVTRRIIGQPTEATML